MASLRMTAEKSANAVKAIKTATTALAEQFGLDLPEFPKTNRMEADFARATELEYVGNILTTLVEALSPSQSQEKPKGKNKK